MATVKDRFASAKTALSRKVGISDRVTTGIENQPVASVEWVDRSEIRVNGWNPNYVPPPEMRLLRTSILADGWTQAIVVSELPEPDEDGVKYEVTDGEHRWIVSNDPEVFVLTGGMVPVVILRPVDEAHRMASTIRHNRARGQHHVLSIADVVATLISEGVPRKNIEELLGMEEEEIERMLDRGNMLKRGGAEGFQKGWVPS